MAHMVETLAYSGKTPWHEIGHRMTDAERRDLGLAMMRAGLDWEVIEVVLSYQDTRDDSARILVPDSKGLLRSDNRRYLSTVGGTAGNGYTVLQNAECAAIVQPLIDAGYTVECAAALDSGRRCFALLKMPDEPMSIGTLADGTSDDVRGYVCVTWSHDGTGALKVIFTPIRTVCQNTLNLAMNTAHATFTSIKHTKSGPQRTQDAQRAMRDMAAALRETGDTFAALAARKMSPAELADYIETVIPNPTPKLALSDVLKARREAIADLVFNGRGQAGAQAAVTGEGATAWHAYNAVTEYFDHYRPREAKSSSAATAAAESSILGGNAKIKANALRVLVAA